MTPKQTSSGQRIITGLDIGTTKICAIIGQCDEQNELRVLGMGSNPSKGLRKGMVVDFNSTVDSIEKAVSKAEQIAGVEAREVYVGITGGHMKSYNNRAAVEISSPMRGVYRTDLERVIEAAEQRDLPPDHEIIFCSPEEFFCDGVLIKSPEGRHCQKLEVNCHVVITNVTAGQNLTRCISHAGLRLANMLFESVASAQSTLNDNEKDLGALMIDIGGGTSDLIIYEDKSIRHSACIPYGGDDITSDIQRAFNISALDAENIKKRSGSAYAAKVDEGEMLELNCVFSDKRLKIRRRQLAEIIQARCQEILELIWKNVEESSFNSAHIGGIILTGGTSLLEHLPALCERMHRRPVKIGLPQNIKGMTSIAASPIYATAIGLLLYGLTIPPNMQLTGGGYLKKIKVFFQSFTDWYG